MKQLSFVPLSLTLVAAALPAQQTYVSPPGYTGVEGNSSSAIPFDYLQARAQQADANQIGTPMAVTAISFRQNDSTSSGSANTPRDVEIRMGTCDLASFSNTFASNYLTGPVTVFANRTVMLPDWSVRPATAPAPFSFRFVLDAPFPYLGQDAIVWDIAVTNGSTLGTFSQDWVSAARTVNGATSTALGTGCTTPNGTMRLTTSFSADVQDLRLSFSTLDAPSNAPVVLLLGLTDPNVLLPGICTTLHTDALVNSVLGVSSSTGSLSSAQIIAPWQDFFSGVPLYSQTISPDPTQVGIGIAATNGRMSPMPLTRGGPAPVNVRRTYSTSSATATTGTSPSTSAVVTLYEY